MALPYIPTTWLSGDIVSSARLNKLEGGVKENSDAILENTADVNTLKSQINEVESGFPQKSASGAIVTIEDGADNVPVVSLTAEIVPVQSGTGDPAPDNVRPISGWTGANVFDTGVNVWDEEWEVGGLNSNNGANYNNAQDRIRSKNHIPVKGGTQYFLKSTAPFTTICFYDSAKAFISSRGTTAADTTLTMPTNAAFMRFEASSAYGTSYKHDISINYPSSDTSYHAYTGRTVNITFPDSAGTVYGGELSVVDGKAVVTVTDTKVTPAKSAFNRSSDHMFYFNTNPQLATGSDVPCICDKLRSWDGTESKYKNENYCFCNNGGAIRVNTADAFSTAADAFDAIGEMTFVCRLATPITIEIEDPVILKTLLGFNNIWLNSGDITLTYRADPATYTAEQIRIMLNAMVAPVEQSTTASKAYNVNDFLIYNNTLYKVIANIASGGTITINTNVSATTIGAEITNILNN